MWMDAILPITAILLVFGGFTALAVRSNRQVFLAGGDTARGSVHHQSSTQHATGKVMAEAANQSPDYDQTRLISELTEQLHELSLSQQDLKHDLRERDILILEMKDEIEKWMSRVPALAEEIKQRTSELKQRALTIQELELRLKETSKLERDYMLQGKMIAVFNQQLDDARDANERLSREISRLQSKLVFQGAVSNGENCAPPELFPTAPPQIDDLTVIKGIGKGFASRLNDIGIYTVQQIAALEPDNIRWMEQQLQGLRGRAARDGWVQQAVELCSPALNQNPADRPESRPH